LQCSDKLAHQWHSLHGLIAVIVVMSLQCSDKLAHQWHRLIQNDQHDMTQPITDNLATNVEDVAH